MASVQEKESIEETELNNEEAEKTKQETNPVVEEKWTPNEEPEVVVVHEGDPDEDDDEELEEGTEDNPDQKFGGSDIVDDDDVDEASACFDVAGDAEADVEVEESQAHAI